MTMKKHIFLKDLLDHKNFLSSIPFVSFYNDLERSC